MPIDTLFGRKPYQLPPEITLFALAAEKGR